MAKTYRELQTTLKTSKNIGRIPNSFRLNQKKTVLEAKVKRIVKDRQNELRKVTKRINDIGYTANNVNNSIPLNKYVNAKDVITRLASKVNNQYVPVIKYTVNNSNRYYTITRRNANKLINKFGTNENELFIDQVDIAEVGSDADVIINYTGHVGQNQNLVYQWRRTDIKENGIKKRKNEGAFFPYFHNMDFDLSRYGIFNLEQPKNYENNCLIQALINSEQLEEKDINYVKTFCKNDMIPKTSLKTICEKLNICIKLNIKRKNENTKKDNIIEWINKKVEKVINIGLIESHYFLFEKVAINSFAIKNYDDVKDIKDWHKICSIRNEKYVKQNRMISSYDVITILLENKDKRLVKITREDDLIKTNAYIHLDTTITKLDYNENNCREVIYKDKSIDKEGVQLPEENIDYLDFETTIDGEVHIPYLCSVARDDNVLSFIGEDCGLQYLKSITRDTKVIIHNLGYDIRFILSHLKYPQIILKSATTSISASGLFYNRDTRKNYKLSFQCSYAMIGAPLSRFGKMFGLQVKKEILPYGAYTKESVTKQSIKISEAIKHIKPEDVEEFKKNIKDWGCNVGKTEFNHILYSQKYCEMDVKVTKQGYEKFREWIKIVTGLDITRYLTLASVGDAYLKKEGCYDGVYELSGIPQQFISKSIVGGRTMCRDNKKWHVNDKLQDFDAVSLYPSAMSRMNGFLKGKPQIIKDLNYNSIKDKSGYFVEINITKVNKHRHFPLMSRTNDDGIRDFSNDLLGIHFVDKTTLEDLIKYQQIEFTIIRGYFFNEGHNTKVNLTIRHLFEARLKAKKEGNPIQEVYKLLMNSSYGKSILKPIDEEIQIIDKNRFDTFFVENYNYIISYTDICKSNYVLIKKIKPINDHYNCPQVGSEILSISKRIMNEVICLAEDLNCIIYYQDTDSMHIKEDDLDKLVNTYREIHNKELVGKNMGQFHCDFDFEGNPVSIESYFLGKKCYIDKIQCDNNVINHHIRMKGVPSIIVKEKCPDGEYMDLYKKLYDGKKVKFDLLSSSKVFFRGNFDMSISTRGNMNDEFTRVLSFKNSEIGVL